MKLEKILFFILMLGLAAPVYASGIDVGSVDLGVLRFNESNSESTTVSINWTEAGPYQVSMGGFSIISDTGVSTSVGIHAVAGSNSYGTLFGTSQGAGSVSYRSNPAGASDSFEIVVTKSTGTGSVSGFYSGDVEFILRSDDGSVELSAFMTVSFEIDVDLHVEVQGSSSSDGVELVYSESGATGGGVAISFSNNGTGSTVEITQDASDIRKADGSVLPAGTLIYQAEGGPSSLTSAATKIYQSTAESGSVGVDFFLNEELLEDLMAGEYTGSIVYTVKWGTKTYTSAVYLSVRIEPIFKMEVSGADGSGAGVFSFQVPNPAGLVAGDPSPEIGFSVNIKTNMGKSYKVFLKVQTPLMNEQGEQFPPAMFLFQTDSPTGGSGTTHFNGYSQVPVGTLAPIFSSNGSGKSASFGASFKLDTESATDGIPGGNYRAPFTFTAVQN